MLYRIGVYSISVYSISVYGIGVDIICVYKFITDDFYIPFIILRHINKVSFLRLFIQIIKKKMKIILAT